MTSLGNTQITDSVTTAADFPVEYTSKNEMKKSPPTHQHSSATLTVLGPGLQLKHGQYSEETTGK